MDCELEWKVRINQWLSWKEFLDCFKFQLKDRFKVVLYIKCLTRATQHET
jgi:hypothetical protein